MEKYSEKELHRKHLLNHIQILEQPITENFFPKFKASKTDETYKLEYLKNKLNDLRKIKTTLDQESLYHTTRLNEIDMENKEINYELKIAKKDRDEVITDKGRLETELFKFRVKIF
jgi:hypothetical protein